ncbi:unnamed protein product, partial [Meganyctiphanes norvegica]
MAVSEIGLLGRFRGCQVGALLGDCLGAPFEGEAPATRSVLNNYFKRLRDPDLKVPYKAYTDDYAMTKCIAQSLLDCKKFDDKDIAKKFVKEFFAEPDRGYGGNVVDVFAQLRASKFSDVYAPAALQFNGSGSYGNGGAMRISPIALFCYNDGNDEVIDMARKSALLTHANRLGYNGAIMQCLAVHTVLHTDPGQLDSAAFVKDLIVRMKKAEKPTEDDILDKGENPYYYASRLEKVLELLERGDSVSQENVEEELGVHISAHMSVPTALYAFMRALKPIKNIEGINTYLLSTYYNMLAPTESEIRHKMAGNMAGEKLKSVVIVEMEQRHGEWLEESLCNQQKQLQKRGKPSNSQS